MLNNGGSMLKTITDKNLLKEHMAESVMATVIALVLLGTPILMVVVHPDHPESALNWVKDMGFLMGLAVLLLIFRTPDIFTARNRLKELAELEKGED